MSQQPPQEDSPKEGPSRRHPVTRNQVANAPLSVIEDATTRPNPPSIASVDDIQDANEEATTPTGKKRKPKNNKGKNKVSAAEAARQAQLEANQLENAAVARDFQLQQTLDDNAALRLQRRKDQETNQRLIDTIDRLQQQIDATNSRLDSVVPLRQRSANGLRTTIESDPGSGSDSFSSDDNYIPVSSRRANTSQSSVSRVRGEPAPSRNPVRLGSPLPPHQESSRRALNSSRQESLPVRATLHPDTTRTPGRRSGSHRRSQLTEKITPLDDGVETPFLQWRASIEDRLSVNADHYPSERSRMALIWGATQGLARTYIEANYTTGLFDTAQQMIEMLQSYYVTGQEQVEYRSVFRNLSQHTNERFPAFRARFSRAAINAKVPSSTWFDEMWERLNASTRMMAIPTKPYWGEDFQAMVNALTSYDIDSRSQNFTALSNNSTARKTAANTVSNSRKPHERFASKSVETPSLTATPNTPRVAFDARKGDSKSLNHSSSRIPSATDPLKAQCYNCHQVGHMARECTNPKVVNELVPVESSGEEVDEQNEYASAEEGKEWA